jgi:peptidyl-prolyl cis-trans isomerase D
MISWIQRTFQQHFRTIFAILLTVTIISFIFTIGASPGIGHGDRRVVARPFFGYDLNQPDDQQRIFGDGEISVRLQFGAFAGADAAQIQNFALQRAATLHLADQWKIPAATTAEITEAIKNCRMFAGQDGQFDAKVYATFRDNLKTSPRGTSEGDIARVLGDDVRAEKVNKLLAGPGYVLPADVKLQLSRADTSWTLATGTVDYAAFKPEIKASDVELAKWFEESGGRYDVPPKVTVGAVVFDAAAYTANVSLPEADVRAFYDANPSRFPKANESKPVDPKTVANPAADFAAVRPQVEAALKLERAQALAVKAASDLTLALFEARITSQATLETYLAAKKLAVKALAPFSRETGPVEFGGSPEVATEAFRLGQDRLVSEAVTIPNGAAVLIWRSTQPSRKPLLAEVKDKVTADYVENERRKRFVELGKSIKAQLEGRLKGGETFEKAAAANSTKIETKSIASFTLRSRPQDLDYSILGTLERLEQGQLSDMVIAADKGLFVFAAEKKAPDLSEANPRFTETRAQLGAYTSRLGASAVISDMVEQELKRSEPKSE